MNKIETIKMRESKIEMEPKIIAETESFIVVYKPPYMHSAPLAENEKGTLLDWTAQFFPDVLLPRGRKAMEGGLLHRLDYETHGLVLIARTQDCLDSLIAQQVEGLFVKEYEAVSMNSATPEDGEGTSLARSPLPGFPPAPFCLVECKGGRVILESAFRPYGKGQKSVRPVLNESENGSVNVKTIYKTEGTFYNGIIDKTETGRIVFRIKITRGYRHQIRCHLAWLGYPILNDSLYGGALRGEPMALCAQTLSFCDPQTGEERKYSL
jgi:23S rRNA pseudouridine1911/1915/1917 synthase